MFSFDIKKNNYLNGRVITTNKISNIEFRVQISPFLGQNCGPQMSCIKKNKIHPHSHIQFLFQ